MLDNLLGAATNAPQTQGAPTFAAHCEMLLREIGVGRALLLVDGLDEAGTHRGRIEAHIADVLAHKGDACTFAPVTALVRALVERSGRPAVRLSAFCCSACDAAAAVEQQSNHIALALLAGNVKQWRLTRVCKLDAGIILQ